MHFSWSFFFFLRECVTSFPFCFLALGLVTLCFCSCRRCCPDRPVVFSRTLSSTKITRAVRMSWTSSSMVESSSSLFFWTPWVNYTSAQHLDSLASLEKPFYWWCKLKFKRGTGQWLVGESHRDVCIKRTLLFFTLLRKLLSLEQKQCWEFVVFVSMFCLRWYKLRTGAACSNI